MRGRRCLGEEDRHLRDDDPVPRTVGARSFFVCVIDANVCSLCAVWLGLGLGFGRSVSVFLLAALHLHHTPHEKRFVKGLVTELGQPAFLAKGVLAISRVVRPPKKK